MRRLNPDHVERVIELVNQSPYFALINTRLVEMREGYSRAVADLDRKHQNAFVCVHGGAYASFVDCAAYWALYCELEEDAGFITLDLTINNLRASSGEGVVTIESGVVKRGGSICLTEAEARDERGRLLVHCLSKQYLSPTLQPISMAVREMGFDPLPPKFLDD